MRSTGRVKLNSHAVETPGNAYAPATVNHAAMTRSLKLEVD